MGLQQESYSIEAAPDWTTLAAALEASMGVHVRVVRTSATMASLRASSIAGSADVSFAGGHLEWEAPLDANPYFVEHLHQALVGLGARPLRQRAPRDEYRGVPWRALPLRRRLAFGLVGKTAAALFWLLMLPLLFVGFVVANVAVRPAQLAWKRVRRMRGG